MSGYSIPNSPHGRIKVRWGVEDDHVTIEQANEGDEWSDEIHVHTDDVEEFCRAVMVQARGVNRSK